MANIRFNKTAFSCHVGNYNQTNSWLPPEGYAPMHALSGCSAGSCILNIYKGTIESFPSFTNLTTRSSDLLISFSLPGGSSSFINLTNAVSTHLRMLVGRCLTSTAASASGLASWFLLTRSTLHGGSTNLTTQAGVLGTVGLSGSGADLEIPQTTITSGQYYRSNGFYINLPLDYTF